jgi:hypothetical protein
MLKAEWWKLLRGSLSTGAKEDDVKYWARLGCWISPCYGPFSLGGSFEIYKPFISLISHFFSGRGEPWITESADTESADTSARLYFLYYHNYISPIFNYHFRERQATYIIFTTFIVFHQFSLLAF